MLSGDALALPIMDYEWTGLMAADTAYRALRPAFAETKSPALPNGLNLGRQLHWQQTHCAQAFTQADAIVCYPQFWAWFLTGQQTGEVTSLGAHTDLWDPAGRRLSSLARRAGWQHRWPALRPAWSLAGRLRPQLAQRTGLAPSCRVLTGLHDSNASYLRHLIAHDKPFTVVSTGTWIIMMAAGGDLASLDERFDMLANVDIHGDPVPSARFMGGREYAAIAGEDGLGVAVAPSDVATLIADSSMALPSFADAGGPFGNRRGAFTGPPAATPRAKAALATLYCALVCDYALDRLGATAGDLIIEGSLTRNRTFCGLLARLRGQRVLVSNDETGTVTGAALLAGRWPPRIEAATGAVAVPSLPGLAAYKADWIRQAESARRDGYHPQSAQK